MNWLKRYSDKHVAQSHLSKTLIIIARRVIAW